MTDPLHGGSPGTNRIRVLPKIAIYVVAWLGALLATNPDCGYWSMAWLFPLGLAGFVNPRWGNDGGWWVFGGCVAVYLIHGYFYFRSRTTRTTLLLLGVLALLLICNISGCRAMLPSH